MFVVGPGAGRRAGGRRGWPEGWLAGGTRGRARGGAGSSGCTTGDPTNLEHCTEGHVPAPLLGLAVCKSPAIHLEKLYSAEFLGSYQRKIAYFVTPGLAVSDLHASKHCWEPEKAPSSLSRTCITTGGVFGSCCRECCARTSLCKVKVHPCQRLVHHCLV